MNRFEKMKQQLKEGVKIETAPLLYPTPIWLADYMVAHLELSEGASVLEPSAGTGRLLTALNKYWQTLDVVAVEINYNLVTNLQRFFKCRAKHGDFLEMPPEAWHSFDAVIMNPPFNKGADIKHIQHALKFLKPNGQLVAICANGPRQNKILKPLCDIWEPLPSGTFKEADTNVETVFLKIIKKEVTL